VGDNPTLRAQLIEAGLWDEHERRDPAADLERFVEQDDLTICQRTSFFPCRAAIPRKLRASIPPFDASLL
jgi:hypothetical protein